MSYSEDSGAVSARYRPGGAAASVAYPSVLTFGSPPGLRAPARMLILFASGAPREE